MDLDIAKFGDSLEKEFSDLIKQKIPNYELIWKTYIGHDGSGKMLPSIGLNENQKKNRVLFSEYHYTILESIVGLNLIIEKTDNYSYNTVRNLVLQNNDIIAFHAHIGRIRDCIKRIGEMYKIKNLHLKFDKCWSERSAVLHNKKLPIAIIDGIYCVLKDTELSIIKDDNNLILSWNDFDDKDFDFLNDYLKTTYNSVIVEVNSSLAKVFETLKKEHKGFKFNFDCFNNNNDYLDLSNIPIVISQSSATLSDIEIIDNEKIKKRKK